MKTNNLLLIAIIFISAFLVSCENNILPELNDSELTNTEANLKAAPKNGWFYILNKESGKCFCVKESNDDVVKYSYWGGSSQKWYLESVGSGYYKLRAAHNKTKYLEIKNGSKANGGGAVINSYENKHQDHFKFSSVGSGYYKITNRNSGKVLDYKSNNSVVQWNYWGGDKQKWILIPAGGNGKLEWKWNTSNVPSAAKKRITDAMNAAVKRYNKWGNWPKRTITVQYNENVNTADGSTGGNIRFGKKSNYQTERVALHEISHTCGVGFWAKSLIDSNNKYSGENGLAVYRSFKGNTAKIATGGSHFWHLGLNYDTENNETDKDRHCQVVWAMRTDGMVTY